MDIDLETGALKTLSPAGHYLALRIGFAFPMFEQYTLPPKWVERYLSRGLLMSDPVMRWMFENVGARRWSDLGLDDPRSVLKQAEMYGLHYGVAICCIDQDPMGQRSFGSFARSDREFTDGEIDALQDQLQGMHDALVPPKNLTKAELEALRMVKNGLLMKEIANLLGVSEGAVKQRLKNAKVKLKAKTSTHAATMATSFGLI
ncbi:MAG: LuxR family transcriptional regulator [Rhodobacter sp.]|nr:LuxR family transcriptional regulator [Rhodobacter sp.]